MQLVLPEIPYELFQEEIDICQRSAREHKKDFGWTRNFPGCNFDNLDIAALLGELGVKLTETNSKEPGKYWLPCPWRGEHGETKIEDTTIWIRAGQWPEFSCSHSHCKDRLLKDLLEWTEERQKGIVKKYCVNRFLRVYYDKGDCYYIADKNGKIIKANLGLLRSYLKQNQLIELPVNYQALDDTGKKAAYRQALEREVVRIATEDNVAYAGEIAGHHTGLQLIKDQRILITEGPRLITPRKGDFGLVEEILFNQCGQGKRDDKLYFDLWNKFNVESLYSGHIRPGQAVVLIGPKGSGKNLIQTCIITPLLGGRVADPTQYALGVTAFNDAMIRAEHLMIADQRGYRRNDGEILGSFIKKITGNREIEMHLKNRPAFTTYPFHRLSMSFNEREEDLKILPDVNDEEVLAKMLILYIEKHPLPMPSVTAEEQEALSGAILGVLPCYLYYLLNELRIPDQLKDDRFGVKPYCSPQVHRLLEKYSEEGKLIATINESDFFKSMGVRTYWEGTATDLRFQLVSRDIIPPAMTLRELGILLTNLAGRDNPQVYKTNRQGTSWYKLMKPSAI
jgi:hypothetical protein